MPHSSEQKADPLDILGFAESTLAGVIRLAGQILRTSTAFLFRPDDLWQASRPFPQSRNRHVAPPLTHLVVFLVLYASITYVDSQKDPLPPRSNPLLRLIPEGVVDLNFGILLLLVLPFILAVGLYAWCIASCSRELSYQDSILLAAYFCGTVYSMLFLLSPLRLAEISYWREITILVALAVVLKSLHSYFLLLSTHVGSSRRQMFINWAKGMALFLFLFSAALLWVAPLVSLLEVDRTPNSGLNQTAPLRGAAG